MAHRVPVALERVLLLVQSRQHLAVGGIPCVQFADRADVLLALLALLFDGAFRHPHGIAQLRVLRLQLCELGPRGGGGYLALFLLLARPGPLPLCQLELSLEFAHLFSQLVLAP